MFFKILQVEKKFFKKIRKFLKNQYNTRMKTFNTFPWKMLLDWYKSNGRHDLPWRDYTISSEKKLLYRVWISEIFLQQTQAERVVGFFEKILQKFSDIHILAETDYDTFFPYYQGLGYYSRARNLLKTAKIVSEDFWGIFPKDKKTLKKLPGIGEYTSSAILCFGYWEPFLAWDTNLEKIFSRFYHGSKNIKLTEWEKLLIENDFFNFLKNFSEKEKKQIIRNINNALMDFARKVDDNNKENIDWKNYPLPMWKFYESKGINEEKTKIKKEVFPIADAKIIVILHENHKVYFSENHNTYTPFILKPAEQNNIREYVKNFFKNNFSLDVSVRPVHKKWFSKKSEPFIAVNVQIQKWSSNFWIFSKQDAKKIIENIYCS